MQLPRILIPTPTSFDVPYNTQCWPEYAAAVRQAGGEPVSVALTHSDELGDLVEAAAGILLPGSGADVDPSRYGHPRDPASARPDPLREQTDRALLEAAERSRKPLLGICLGLQSMNVYYGGTLIQDVLPMPVNHRAGRAVQTAHRAVVNIGSRLGSSVRQALDFQTAGNDFGWLPVNSSHHQAVDVPGEQLRVAARCPDDGVIEALEGSNANHWLLGVQWHPERTLGTSDASRALFKTFVAVAAGRCRA